MNPLEHFTREYCLDTFQSKQVALAGQQADRLLRDIDAMILEDAKWAQPGTGPRNVFICDLPLMDDTLYHTNRELLKKNGCHVWLITPHYPDRSVPVVKKICISMIDLSTESFEQFIKAQLKFSYETMVLYDCVKL